MTKAGDPPSRPFARVHRSHLVNAWHLRSLTAERAELDDGTVVNISSRRITEIRARMRSLHRPRTLPLREVSRIVNDAR